MKNINELLAHYDSKNLNKKQGLMDHLINVAKTSKDLGALVGLENSSQLIGLLHDFGKNSDEFQKYIRGEYKGRVNHSSAGALTVEKISKFAYYQYEIDKLLNENSFRTDKSKNNLWTLYKEILQYPILAHHGLYDIIDKDYEYRTEKRLSSYNKHINLQSGREKEFLNKLNKKYRDINGKFIEELYYEGFKEFIPIYKKIQKIAPKVVDKNNIDERKKRAKALHFYYGALVRLLLSILKEADIYDSSNYFRTENDKKYSKKELSKIWIKYEKIIEEQYGKFRTADTKSELNATRTRLSDDIYKFSKVSGKGAYTMDLPVGSGKTYAGLRFAVGNASNFSKNRIFYTTAYLSVLEQNAFTIKDLLGEEYILEHHSNIIQTQETNEDERDKKDYEVGEYLKESWESPLVLTSLVQLSNTLFKGRAANIRRFSKLINSVIIIDEIQSLPTKALYNFNLMTNFLTTIMNSTIIHCTATPPGYDNKKVLSYPCIYGVDGSKKSVLEEIEDKKIFDRVDYYNLLGGNLDVSFNSQDIIKHIKKELIEENSALLVLNTKAAVKTLYDNLISDEEIIEKNIEIIYLTTNQCPSHRLDIIRKMKDRLKLMRASNVTRKIICVSTKLVEAGVDIDFDIVYRSNAGIDNIIQVGGRCNREGKKNSKGKVFIFDYNEEKLKYLPDIEKQRAATITALKVLKRKGKLGKTIDIEEANQFYFHKLYQNEEGLSNHMEYITEDKNDTVLNLLSNNTKTKKNYENKNGVKIDFRLRQSFKSAAKEFNLIDNDSLDVIVQYKNKDIIDALYEAIEVKDFFSIKQRLKELQPYTIGIRNIEGYENYITREMEGDLLILSKEAYDEDVGLNKGSLQLLMF